MKATVSDPTFVPEAAPVRKAEPSRELAEEIDRLQREEQAKIDRRRQEELDRFAELARYD